MLLFLQSSFASIDPSRDGEVLNSLKAVLHRLTTVNTFAIAVTLLVVDKITAASKPATLDKKASKAEKQEAVKQRTADYKFALWYVV